MGRKQKQGISYFQADVNIFQDRKIKRLLRSAGGKGFTIYIYLLTCIYRDQGYYFDWDEYSGFDISDELNFSENVVEESVRACCTLGLFNEDLWAAKSVLTSESIQTRWQKIVTGANRVVTEIDPDLKIIDGKPLFLREKIPKYTEEIPEKSRESTQSKEKESKEKESKEDTNAREVNAFVGMELEQLHKLNTPLQANELEKLRADFSDDTVRDVLIAMENHKKLTKKYTSAYLTALNWCKRRNENHGQSESPVRTAGDREVDQLRNTHF